MDNQVRLAALLCDCRVKLSHASAARAGIYDIGGGELPLAAPGVPYDAMVGRRDHGWPEEAVVYHEHRAFPEWLVQYTEW